MISLFELGSLLNWIYIKNSLDIQFVNLFFFRMKVSQITRHIVYHNDKDNIAQILIFKL